MGFPQTYGRVSLTGDPNHAKRHESIEHWYWKLALAQKFQKEGCQVQVEKDGVDIALEKDGKRIAVEIETGTSDSDANVRRDVEAGFDDIIVVWINKRPADKGGHSAAKHVTLAELLKDSIISVT